MDNNNSNNNKKRYRDGCILDYIDAPKTKRRMEEKLITEKILNSLSSDELMNLINRKLNERGIKGLIICYECEKLTTSSISYLSTSKWGYERPFCNDCTLWCGDKPYSSYMSYEHDECECQNDEEELSNSSNDEKQE